MPEPLTVRRGERRSVYADSHRPEGGHLITYSITSATTYAVAVLRSSVSDTCRRNRLRSTKRLSSAYTRTTGLPETSLRTSTECQRIGARIPSPSALATASFAANRVDKYASPRTCDRSCRV